MQSISWHFLRKSILHITYLFFTQIHDKLFFLNLDYVHTYLSTYLFMRTQCVCTYHTFQNLFIIEWKQQREYLHTVLKRSIKRYFITVLTSSKCKSEHYTYLFLACHCLDLYLLRSLRYLFLFSIPVWPFELSRYQEVSSKWMEMSKVYSFWLEFKSDYIFLEPNFLTTPLINQMKNHMIICKI